VGLSRNHNKYLDKSPIDNSATQVAQFKQLCHTSLNVLTSFTRDYTLNSRDLPIFGVRKIGQ
jgi:hypothetical protein